MTFLILSPVPLATNRDNNSAKYIESLEDLRTFTKEFRIAPGKK